jgi:phosphoglucosamine mutase
MKTLFGTDGIRGEAGQFPLDASTVTAIGFSLASHIAKVGGATEIVIGRDTRESGESIERALIEGATKAGAKCLSAGVITTPGVAFLTRALQAAAGVVISASHNPYQDNGIKIFAPSGQKMDDSIERLIEADVLAPVEKPEAANGVPRTQDWKRTGVARPYHRVGLRKRRQLDSRALFVFPTRCESRRH